MRILLFCLSCVLFVWCSLPWTQTESKDSVTIIYEGSWFSTFVPSSWEKAENTILPMPVRGSIALAVMSPDVRYGFSNNYIVMADSLDMPITSKKYSELNHIQTTKNYLEYTKLQELPIVFWDSDTSLLYVFEARYNKTTPRMKFIQTAKVCGTRVYLLHIAVSLDKTPDKYIELMKTFVCK
jgi:hypothetical protein